MKQIIVNFQTHHPLVINLEDSETAELYLTLLQDNLTRTPPMWRDPMKYDIKYFRELCKEIKEKLGWDWDMTNFTMASTVDFHKDIENFLEKDRSFRNIPGEHQNLLHEAHFCIHTIQHRDDNFPRGSSLQFEWFNDDYVVLPDNKVFEVNPGFGDIILQNPYVGHPPIQCWQNNDYKNITRTCAYHDRILPGLKINLTHNTKYGLNLDKYKGWWTDECADFVAINGMEKIIKYTGFPIIGQVLNKDHLEKIVPDKELKFEGIEIQ